MGYNSGFKGLICLQLPEGKGTSQIRVLGLHIVRRA